MWSSESFHPVLSLSVCPSDSVIGITFQKRTCGCSAAWSCDTGHSLLVISRFMFQFPDEKASVMVKKKMPFDYHWRNQ